MAAFSIKIPVNDPAKMEKFQEFMDEVHDSEMKYIQKLSEEMNVSFGCASHVVYLRSRSRWSEKLEAELIQAYRSGKNPSFNDF